MLQLTSNATQSSTCHSTKADEVRQQGENILALVGPPNAGKTSLYNVLTGSRYATVNYPGATVDCGLGKIRSKLGLDAQVIDTPGIYSLVPRSEDERVTTRVLTDLNLLIPEATHPDLIICVVDACQPTRHLQLAMGLQRAGYPMVIALTMNDLAARQCSSLNAESLGKAMNLPVVEVNGRTGKGVEKLVQACREQLGHSQVTEIVLPAQTDPSQLEKDFSRAEKLVAKAQEPQNTSAQPQAAKWEYLLDALFLHPILGFLTFFVIMAVVFWSVFSAAAPFMDAIEIGVGAVASFLTTHLPDSIPTQILTEGLISGIGAVLVFVPQIAILFLAIGILEDSGYLARGAILVDRPLSYLGLNGKSFVPLLSGKACAIPAMMAARNVPGKKERFLTIFIIPLMSCSARLPVYGLLLSFLAPPGKRWLAGIGLTAIYFGSIIFASVSAAIAGRLMKIEPSRAGFQMELPKWRLPSLRHLLTTVRMRLKAYLLRAGKVILIVTLLFWFFANFPSEQNSMAAFAGKLLEPLFAPMGVDWRVGMALIAAFAAREIFVSSLAVAFAVQGNLEESLGSLVEAMRQAVFAGTNQPVFTIASAVGLILFFMISLQCITTVAVAKKETGSWKIPLIQLSAYTVAGYIIAVIAVQGLRAIGVQ